MENGIRCIKYAHISARWDKNWGNGNKIEAFDQVEYCRAKIQISFIVCCTKIKINIKY